MGPQLEVELRDPQVHQGEGPLPGHLPPDGPVRLPAEADALLVRGGGGPLYGLDPSGEPGRGPVQALGELRGAPGLPVAPPPEQGLPPRTGLRRMAHGGRADQFLPLGEERQARLPVVGAPHPAGAKAHVRGGEEQLLAEIAALLLQVLQLPGTGEEKVVLYSREDAPGLLRVAEGLRPAADELDMEPGALVAPGNGLAQLAALFLADGVGQIGAQGASDGDSFA